MNRKALVLGGTGLIGGHLLKELSNRVEYAEVISLVRRSSGISTAKVKEYIIDFENLADYRELFKVDDVFCCLGTTMKKAGSKEAFKRVDFSLPVLSAELGASRGAGQFLVVPSMGADKNSVFFYNRVKGEMETQVKKLRFKEISIFRPSLLLGQRKEFRFGEKAAEVVSKPLSGLFKGRLKKYSPINGETVASAMANEAAADKEGIRIYESDLISKLARADK